MKQGPVSAVLTFALLVTTASFSQTNSPNKPTWWQKYQTLLNNGNGGAAGASNSLTVGPNVDVSNECGPQSETYVAINEKSPKNLAGGSNEIFRDPMRGYASFDGGLSWTGVDLPLPAPLSGTNDSRFGSDPSLAFDTLGNLYYSYIVVFFGGGNGVNGTEMAVAKSTDGGRTYPSVSYFSFATGGDHFNDKPMITTDRNARSPFQNNVYVTWDAASGGSSDGGVRVGASADGGATFAVTRVDAPSGPSQSIAAVPFVGPNGEVYVAWNDYGANTIAFNRSFDGGGSWGIASVAATKQLAFDIAIPAESFRGALDYPSCDVDRSKAAHRGRLYCAYMDVTSTGNTDIKLISSDDQGSSWSTPIAVTDPLLNVDRFNQWLAVDAVTGNVNVSFYDTRNDTTGHRYQTDIYLSQSTNGGASFSTPNTRVSNVSSNEHDCNGVYPCSAIDYGNQQGDYAGLAAYGGYSHPFWTDSRRNQQPLPKCNAAMEEVFTATVQ